MSRSIKLHSCNYYILYKPNVSHYFFSLNRYMFDCVRACVVCTELGSLLPPSRSSILSCEWKENQNTYTQNPKERYEKKKQENRIIFQLLIIITMFISFCQNWAWNLLDDSIFIITYRHFSLSLLFFPLSSSSSSFSFCVRFSISSVIVVICDYFALLFVHLSNCTVFFLYARARVCVCVYLWIVYVVWVSV